MDLNPDILKVENLTKYFGGLAAVSNCSLKIKQGSITGIIGPNGSGKSTLYNIIIGQHMADKGKILINSKDISEIPIHERTKRGLGYLSQQRSVFNMSVYNNLLGICQLSIKNAEEQRRVTEKLLDEFNLQHLRTLNSNVLSGGEVRRLMMARIMINKPKVILLDEPMAALDPIVVQDIQKYILKIQSYGCSILITDHQVRNLFDIVDRAYVLGEQTIIAEGTPSEILKSSKAIQLYFGNQYTSS